MLRPCLLLAALLPFVAPPAQAQEAAQAAGLRPAACAVTAVAISFTVAGALLNGGTLKYRIEDRLPATHVAADDYLQYLQVLAIGAADLAGARTKNSAWGQVKLLALSQLACAAVVQTLKYTVREPRPNGGARNSFPSGHTSVAFVGATVLWYELWDEHPVLSCSGFAVASAVGVLRLTNRRHWVSDVLAGAGIGMLATSVVYYFEPLKRWQPFSKPDKLALMPYYDGAQAGVTLTFKL